MTIGTAAYFAVFNYTGPETTFTPGFVVEQASNVGVRFRDAEGVESGLIQDVHYSVSLTIPGNAVTVNKISFPPAPGQLVVFRDSSVLQETHFVDLEDYQAQVHERLHDRWSMNAAEADGDAARALRLPFGETAPDLPVVALRAGHVIGFDEDGNVIMVVNGGANVVGSAGLFVFLDANNGLITKGITADDLPSAQNNALGAVKAKPAVAHQFLTHLLQDGNFGQAQPKASDLVQGEYLEVNVPGAGTILYNIMRRPGAFPNDTLRAIQLGNVDDPTTIHRATSHVFLNFDGTVTYGTIFGTGLNGFTIDGDLNTIQDLKTSQFAAGQVRELLTANRSYFVDKATGLDTNTGLSGAPFKTIMRAIDVAAALDQGIFAVTINVAAGTYETRATPTGSEERAIVTKSYNGEGPIGIVGAGSTTIINAVGTTGINHNARGRYSFSNMKLQTSGGGFNAITVGSAANLQFNNIDFGTTGGAHIAAAGNAIVTGAGTAYSISGNAGFNHVSATQNATVNIAGKTITLASGLSLGTFVNCSQSAVLLMNANTFPVSAPGVGPTAQKFLVATNGTIDVQGAGINYFPGNTAGITDTATGGVYA